MTQDRKDLSAAEERDLWIKTGGKCALCKSELILTEINEKTNVGDKAHIIGHGTKGPRRNQMKYHKLTEEAIDRPQNLIVLCKFCHKKVDTHPESYSAEYMFKKKKDHEEWVISRLSVENKAIAVVHKTMGEPLDHINLANQAEIFMIDAVVYQNKMENYSTKTWEQMRKLNQEIIEDINASMEEHSDIKLCLFPLSQIPLLIHFGNLITDTVPVDVYQYERDSSKWVISKPDIGMETKLPKLDLTLKKNIKGSKKIVASIGVTSKIHIEDIQEAMGIDDFDLLEIQAKDPEINRVLYQEQVSEVQRLFKAEFERLHQENRYQELHIFYAGPAGLAFEIGRGINPNMYPYVHLYNYQFRESPKYQYTFKI